MSELRFLRELGSEFERLAPGRADPARRSFLRPHSSSPPRDRLGLAVLVISVLLVVAVGAVVLSVGHGKPRASLGHGALAGPPGEPIPRGFLLSSPGSPNQVVTAINARTWWVLGSSSRVCGQRSCAAIIRTTDGGRRFVGIPAPHVPYDPEPEGLTAGVASIYFANARDGYAYYNSLFVTHDGGATWHAARVPERVVAVTSGAGEAYALAESPATVGLVRSPVGKDAWSSVPGTQSATAISAYGRDLYVLVQKGSQTYVLVSHNRGASFAAHYDLGQAGQNGCAIQAVSRSVLWALCQGDKYPNFYRSPDGGRTLVGVFTPTLSNAAVFAAASSTVAVVGFRQMYQLEWGRHRPFTPVRPPLVPSIPEAIPLQWSDLSFTDATHGLALVTPARRGPGPAPASYLCRTLDGGRSYYVIRVP